MLVPGYCYDFQRIVVGHYTVSGAALSFGVLSGGLTQMCTFGKITLSFCRELLIVIRD